MRNDFPLFGFCSGFSPGKCWEDKIGKWFIMLPRHRQLKWFIIYKEKEINRQCWKKKLIVYQISQMMNFKIKIIQSWDLHQECSQESLYFQIQCISLRIFSNLFLFSNLFTLCSCTPLFWCGGFRRTVELSSSVCSLPWWWLSAMWTKSSPLLAVCQTGVLPPGLSAGGGGGQIANRDRFLGDVSGWAQVTHHTEWNLFFFLSYSHSARAFNLNNRQLLFFSIFSFVKRLSKEKNTCFFPPRDLAAINKMHVDEQKHIGCHCSLQMLQYFYF